MLNKQFSGLKQQPYCWFVILSIRNLDKAPLNGSSAGLTWAFSVLSLNVPSLSREIRQLVTLCLGHICGCSHPVAHLEPDGLSLTYVSYGWCWFSAGPCASNRLARASSHGSQLLEEVGEGASPSRQGSACTAFVDIRQSHMAKEVNVGVYSTNVWTQEAMIHWDHYCNSLVGHITFHI